jgi:16S rRNA (guanine527-N7)-methyltransferase
LSRHLAELAAALSEASAPSAVAAGDVQARHIDDALSGLPYVGSPATLVDLGSGPGVPGLVLAAALPDCAVTCVEAVRRKAEWIERAAARCGLENVTVAWARAEEATGRFDVVTARALAALPVLCEYAAPLLADGGRAVFWKGAVAEDEAADGVHAASVLGLSPPEVHEVPGSERRTLWVFRRTAPLPDGYPRRAGMAVKRPLRAVRSAPK